MTTTLPPPTTSALAAPNRAAPPARRRSLGYQPALDGLRAISVIGVLLYHADVSWIPGGFLGVEIFFVISGFLITTLLAEEWQSHGGIDKARFWYRRARRLLPALFAVILAVAVYSVLFLPDEVAKLRGDVVAALMYSTNWFLIFSQQSYFEAFGRPSPLRHLWSLAIEEQFYIVWPIVFGFLLRKVGGQARRLFWPIVGGAVVSTILMAVLFSPDGDPSRVYYGTDTRAAGILLGAALACIWTPWRSSRPAAAKAGPLLEVVGLISLALIGWCFLNAGEFDPWLYRGGFAAISLVTVILIAVIVHPSVRLLSGVLSTRPFTFVGLRSYGLYLWHWPVFVFLTADEVGIDGNGLLALKFAITFALAELSYRFVEMPIRRDGMAPVKRLLGVRGAPKSGAAAWMTAPVLAVVAVTGLLVVAVGSATATSQFLGPGGDIEEADNETLVVGGPIDTTATGSGASPTTIGASTPAATSAPAPGATTPAATTPVTTAPAAGTPPSRIAVVGDSVGMTLVRNAPATAKQQLTITDGSLEGCGIVEGAVRTTAKFRWSFKGCTGWPEKWAANATKAQAQVALVIIGAWDVFDLTQGETVIAFASPEFDQHFGSQLQKGIDALKGAGVKTALLEVPCYRPVSGGGLTALPERGDDARTRHLNELLRQAAAADPANVVFVTGPQQYCTDPALATDLGHRWDGVHYYKPGAQLVWDTIIPELLSIRV